MPVKMRLARHGRKRYAYYHIVVADSRAPRDGRYIERIGSYNPNSNPATIDLDFDKAYDWLVKGAQPTDTVKAILSYKGVLYKKHLMGGVKKGAFDEAEAEKRLDNWMTEKEAKIQAKIDRLENEADAETQKQLAAETKIKEAKAAAIAAKNAELAAEAKAAVHQAEEEVTTEEVETETVAEEAATQEVETETVAEETATEEVETETTTEEVVAEEEKAETVIEEAAVEEAKTETVAEDAEPETAKEETEASAEEEAPKDESAKS
jgi:small subunit ribosomal protein S16